MPKTTIRILQDGEAHHHPHPGYGEKLPEDSRLQALIGARRVGFSLKFDDFDTNLSLITVSRLPGESIDFSVTESRKGSDFVFEPGNELALANANNRWSWKTPGEAGIYGVDIRKKKSGEIMRVQVAVQVPYDGSEYLDGYRIGQYENEPYRGSPRYNKPKGFIKVNEIDLDTWVSPRLKLKQFLCKQEGDFPKYTLLDPRLLVKLELVIDSLEKRGIEANKLHLTSGFRTPFYNKAIGNKSNYSRHCYGDAADLFVDVDGDGRMDDLDADGDLTDNDGALLHAAAHTVDSENEHLVGGLGFYGMARFRNPFIHVDTRGYQARWPADWQSRLRTGKSLMVDNPSGKPTVASTES